MFSPYIFNIEFQTSSIRFSINKRVEVLSNIYWNTLASPDDNRGLFEMARTVDKCR